MIPDTFAGGLLLTVVNMAVVFATLIVIALVINLIRKLVSNGTKHTAGEHAAVSTTSVAQPASPSHQAQLAPQAVPFQSLDPKRKAVIVAALQAYLGYEAVPVFVRRIPDAGAWGKASRFYALNRQKIKDL